jgi:serine/threonine-protein kinase
MTTEWIGRYRIVRPLGEGGMGRILLAEVAGAGGFARRVVLKLVRDELDDGLKQALLDEAKLTATLVHRNIVPVLDLQETGAQRLVVLEHVDGMDVQRLLAQVGRLPWPLAVFVASEVAAGLDYAHRKEDAAGRPLHIVHRDVSPANILLSWEGEVKLADFGIAKVASAERRDGPWVTAGLKGNLGYMAPEQAARGALDPRADIYALGVVLYEMITGLNPWRGTQPSRERAPVPALPPGVAPPALAAIVSKATAGRPEDRFATAALLREALLHLPDQPADPARQLAAFVARLRKRKQLDGEALVAAVLGDKPATRALRQAAPRSLTASRAGVVIAAAVVSLLVAVIVVRLRVEPSAPKAAAATAPPTGAPAALSSKVPSTPSMGSAAASTPSMAAHPSTPSMGARAASTPSMGAPAAPSPIAGPCVLAIASQPAGARVFVDGRAAGRAPAKLTLSCRAAPYQVVLSAPGRSAWERRFTLAALETSVVARLARKGSLSVNAIPWANLFVDGNAVGHTPRRRLPLDGGRHVIRLVTQGGDTRTRSVEITPGHDTKVTIVFSEP